jgi:hypothetical protein
MKNKTCEICGHVLSPQETVIHRIVPEEVTLQANIIDSRTVVLCFNCSIEIQDWYRKKVYITDYDARSKQFTPKPPAELVKEYELAYKTFVYYKRGRGIQRK